jgi:hypothetical protein
MNLLLFILVCWGFTQILVSAKLLDSIRPKYHFFHCSMCVGFWVGILTFLWFWSFDYELFKNIYVGSILFGFISSATSFALCNLFGEDGIRINIR